MKSTLLEKLSFFILVIGIAFIFTGMALSIIANGHFSFGIFLIGCVISLCSILPLMIQEELS